MADADSKKEEKAKTPLPLKIVQIYFLASYFPGVGVMSRLLHIFPVYLLTAAEGFNEFSIPAYVNFMVLDFVTDINHDETKLGYYSGLLGAAIFLGTFLTSFLWGRFADKFGRRKILLLGAFAEMFCILLFGFSRSYWWAVGIRFLSGLLNGNLGVTKTFLAEISDSSNQAAAFTGWTISEVVAGIVGAMLGGYLCQPAKQYPAFFSETGIFGTYPYLLVNLISFTLMCSSFIVSWFFLIESSEYAKTKFKRVDTEDSLDSIKPTDETVSSSDEDDLPVLSLSLDTSESVESMSFWEKVKSVFSFGSNEKARSDGWSLWRDTPALLSAVLYSLVGLCYTTYEFVFISWTAAPVDKGGLSFTPNDVGNLGAFGGAFYIASQISAFFFIMKFGLTKTLRTGLIFTLVSFLLLPCTSWIKAHTSWIVFWLILLTLHFARQLTSAFSYGGVMQMIQNSVLPVHVGTLNGFAQSLVAFNRAAGPSLGTTLLAWSFTNERFPFNYFFTFLLLSVMIAICLLLSFGFPARIDIPLKEQLHSLPPTDSSHDLLAAYTSPRKVRKVRNEGGFEGDGDVELVRLKMDDDIKDIEIN